MIAERGCSLIVAGALLLVLVVFTDCIQLFAVLAVLWTERDRAARQADQQRRPGEGKAEAVKALQASRSRPANASLGRVTGRLRQPRHRSGTVKSRPSLSGIRHMRCSGIPRSSNFCSPAIRRRASPAGHSRESAAVPGTHLQGPPSKPLLVSSSSTARWQRHAHRYRASQARMADRVR